MASSRHNPVPQPVPFPSARNAAQPRRRAAPSGQTEELELRVAMLERERRDFGQQLFEAAQIHRRLSGPRQLQRGPFQIASEVFPLWHVGGDFVCAMDIGPQTWIALGDIGGKGLAAAMWFTHLLSLIRCHAASYGHPAQVMSALNGHLCALQPAPPLTSMLLFVLRPEAAQVEYCNAGHPAPLLLAGGEAEPLEAGGPLLGVLSAARYDSARLQLRAGDLLLGCTDGVLECRNASGEEFGQAGLLRAAGEHAAEPAPALLFSLLGAAQDFAAETPRQDDLSLLVLRHTGVRG